MFGSFENPRTVLRCGEYLDNQRFPRSNGATKEEWPEERQAEQRME
jgi:hypothetical protein